MAGQAAGVVGRPPVRATPLCLGQGGAWPSRLAEPSPLLLSPRRYWGYDRSTAWSPLAPMDVPVLPRAWWRDVEEWEERDRAVVVRTAIRRDVR